MTPGRRIRGFVAWIFAAVVVVGCSSTIDGPQAGGTAPSGASITSSAGPEAATASDPLEPCQDEPFPAAPFPSAASERLTLTWDPGREAFREDPAPLDDALVATTDGAVVQVQAVGGGGMGSGFLVEAAGRPVVVTAAHVTGTMPVADLRVVDLAGNRVGVVEGCYAYQAGEVVIGFDGVVGDIDVAVLVPDGAIGTSALRVAPERAPVGDWVFLDNFQGDFTPAYGRDLYTALVVADPTTSYAALTGIGSLHQPDDRHPPTGPGESAVRPENATIGGASGGAVVDLDGRVVGLSNTQGYDDFIADPAAWLNVHIDGVEIGYATAVEPVVAGMVGPEAITAVLDAAVRSLDSLRATGR